MSAQTAIIIRPMQKHERRRVNTIMRRSFPLIQQLFFSLTSLVLVAEKNDDILGAIVLKAFSLPKKRKGGLLFWGFVSPDTRGQGVGRLLFDAGIHSLEEQGCDEIFGCIEGHNTDSSNLLALRGFEILSPGQQFRRYGLSMFIIWLKIFHYIDGGHFIWVRPAPSKRGNASLQWWGTLTANSLIGMLALWRCGGFQTQPSDLFLGTVLTLLLLFGVRFLGMWLTARVQKISMRFRAWESGYPLGIVIALVFVGGIYPVPGNIYPTEPRWKYSEFITRFGPIALAGTLPVLLLVWFSPPLFQLCPLPNCLTELPKLMNLFGKPLLVFDIILPVFPFVSFNGRRLWDWNKIIWALMALAAMSIIYL